MPTISEAKLIRTLKVTLKALVEALEMQDEEGYRTRNNAIDKALFEANQLLHPRRYEK